MLKVRLKRHDKSCAEELPEAGIKNVKVFVSTNGSKFKRFAKTKRKLVRFRGKPGRRYRFFSVAKDRAGNKEDRPARADAKGRAKRGR